jgi:hypothetical protein
MMREMPVLFRAGYHVLKTWTGIIFFITKFVFNFRNLFFFLYILSPFDLIPEVIQHLFIYYKALFGVFGLVDDASIGYSLMVIFANTVYRFIQQSDLVHND